LTESLNVSVQEFFKIDHVPDDQREMINRLTIDIKGTVITALDGVFKQYFG